jgi:tetratricopeptide (TPR) repeat protein
MAKVYGERRRWAEALDALTIAERIDPSFATTYAYRGKILFNLQRPAEAVADYQKALALQPSLAGVVGADLAAAEAQLARH